jgi:hypothetical protein
MRRLSETGERLLACEELCSMESVNAYYPINHACTMKEIYCSQSLDNPTLNVLSHLSGMKEETLSFSEMLASTHESTQHQNLEDHHLDRSILNLSHIAFDNICFDSWHSFTYSRNFMSYLLEIKYLNNCYA